MGKLGNLRLTNITRYSVMPDTKLNQMLNDSIAYADESKAIARDAIETLRKQREASRKVAQAAIAKYPLL